MALIEQTMTEKGRAARRRNGGQSRGAATPAGKERARAANLRHGMYSKLRDEALEGLGEDPAALAVLIEGAYAQWRPANASQAQMVEKLARLQWGMDRYERMQDNLVADQVRARGEQRYEYLAAQRHRYVDQEGELGLLETLMERPDFYAPADYLASFVETFARPAGEGDEEGGEGEPGGEAALRGPVAEIVEILHRLRKPRHWTPAEPRPERADADREWQCVLEEVGGEEAPLARPEVPVEQEGEARAALRATLRVLARPERAVLQKYKEPFFARYRQPLTPAQRDVLAAEVEVKLESLRREEDKCMRQFWRLGNMLMKMQDRAARGEPEVQGPESEVRSPQSAAPSPGSQRQSPESAVGSPKSRGREREAAHQDGPESSSAAATSVRQREDATAGPSRRQAQGAIELRGGHGQDARARESMAEADRPPSNDRSPAKEVTVMKKRTAENAGASGHMLENTGAGKSVNAANGRVLVGKRSLPTVPADVQTQP
ncbi:MAG TPA: hypothetical protein VL359_08910 [bacterium]|nr:hypothetical protein [bacterium]